MGYKLEGSVAVVTGAGRGIGKAVALGLANKTMAPYLTG
jgi:NAD(P)-dependent dehydrogenase (short-subunit alcohol dehydrogenase family)